MLAGAPAARSGLGALGCGAARVALTGEFFFHHKRLELFYALLPRDIQLATLIVAFEHEECVAFPALFLRLHAALCRVLTYFTLR